MTTSFRLPLLALAAFLPALAAASGDYQRYVNLQEHTGTGPVSSPVQGPDGRMYGTTKSDGSHHRGTVYRIDGRHEIKVLHAFAKGEGMQPTPLTPGADAWLYGGTNAYNRFDGGSIFRVSTNGAFETLCRLQPYAGAVSGQMVRDDNGDLYVALQDDYENGAQGGAIARISPTCKMTILHVFDWNTEGTEPDGGLTLGADGRLYGTTKILGPDNAGAAFVIGKDGSGFTVLHVFDGYGDGGQPQAPLAQGPDGALYGTAWESWTNEGTLFRVTTGGDFSIVHTFEKGDPLGAAPFGGVTFGPDGTMFGTTEVGGPRGGGTLFTMSADGQGTVRHAFSASPSHTDGSQPKAAPTILPDGALWGTTSAGGHFNKGTVYTLGVER